MGNIGRHVGDAVFERLDGGDEVPELAGTALAETRVTEPAEVSTGVAAERAVPAVAAETAAVRST